METLWTAFSLILSIAQLVLLIIVLVKLFKSKGALHGILGIITCGLYPFIWGWIKHKELKLTKIMAAWTITIVAPIVIAFIFMSSMIFMLLGGVKSMDKMVKTTPPMVQRSVKKPARKAISKPVTQKPVKEPEVKAEPKSVTPTLTKVSSKKLTREKLTDREFEIKMETLDNLINRDKENATAFYNRGFLYEYKGDLKMAEKDYTKAISINKSFGDAYYNRGLVYVKTKKYEQAIKDFSETLKLKTSVDAYCNRGNAKHQLGKIDLALDDYNAALKIDPEDADLYYNRAVVYLAKKDNVKAKADFQKAAQMGHNKARKYLKMSPVKPRRDPIPAKTSKMD